MILAAKIIFFLGVLGLACATGFLVLIVVAAVRFRLRKDEVAHSGEWPGVSLMKPLCGMEPGLKANLETFFRQQYPRFEILFGTRDARDPALEVVAELRRKYPQVVVKDVYSGEPARPNAKVCTLEKMYDAATYDYFIISDSDVAVGPGYIENVVRPLLEPGSGVVSCIYRGKPSGGLWSRLEALDMSVEFCAGVIVSDLLEGMTFALGPTMATRRDVVKAVGGMAALADYCADDFVLGNEAHRLGYRNVLSHFIIDHVVVNRAFSASMHHQVRWKRSTRFSRPAGHAASVLSYAMPFALPAALAALVMHHPGWSAAVLLAGIANRVVMCLAAGWLVVRDPRALAWCWVYPLSDLIGFCFWAASYAGSSVVWRGERYRLLARGYMERLETPHASGRDGSESITVDNLP